MTTVAVPPAGSLAWREVHPTPPNARLYTVGPFCPIDDTTLRPRLDGFVCPVCRAGWNCHGLAGRWLPRTEPKPQSRLSPVVAAARAVAGVAVCAVIAVAVISGIDQLDEDLQWWLIAALTAAGVLSPAAGWWSRRVADWPYRHNRLLSTHDGEPTEAALTSSEVAR